MTSPLTAVVAANPPPAPAAEPGENPANSQQRGIRGLVQDRVILPLLHLLRMGASPRRLAWSLAIGAVIGINPIVGSTTLLCLGAAFAFRLNIIASQIANHLLFPVELALFVVYLRAGQILFRTGPPPLATDDILRLMRHHPWATMRLLWTWEWHAIVVWLLCGAVLTPLLAAALHPPLKRLHLSLHHPQAQK